MIRTLTLRADRVDQAARSVEAVIATEAPVAVYDPRSGGAVLESLDFDGLQVADQVPLLADHDRSIPSTLGSVADVRRDGAELLGRLRFASGSAAADEAWALVSQRHARAVSVGYQVAEHETLRPGQTSGRFTAPPDRPLKVARRWRLREVSLVPIGADDGALIRSAYQRSETVMARENLVESLGSRAVNQMTWPELATAILRERGDALPENDADLCRAAFSSVEGVGVLTNIVNSAILAGYRSASDSLAGIYRTVDLPNYLLTELAALDVLPRLERVGRGQVAPAASWSVSASTKFRLAKFGVQFVLDQMDFEDTARLSVYTLALAEIGASVRRLVSDLLYSVLLSNPTLGDGVALFDAARGNLGSAALGTVGLDAAMTTIMGQISQDEDNPPVHLGLVPRFLIVAPGDATGGRTLARTIALGDGSDLVVRADSRLGTAGVWNPSTGEVLAGNGVNWMVASPADQAPSLVLGLLNGQAEPRVRHFELDRGQWGVGFDISFSCGASAIDGRGLYWSTGQ